MPFDSCNAAQCIRFPRALAKEAILDSDSLLSLAQRMFQLFTRLKDIATHKHDNEIASCVDETIELWTQMLEADQVKGPSPLNLRLR